MNRVALLAVAPLTSFAETATASHLVLDAAAPYVAVTLNGVPLRLRAELDHEASVTLNRRAAQRSGLGAGTATALMRMGPVSIRGRSTAAQLVVDGSPVEAVFNWYDRDVTQDADGTISVALLPFDAVTLRSSNPNSVEREVRLATRFEKHHGIHYRHRAGGRNVAVRFSLRRPNSTGTGAAGAAVAAVSGGVFSTGGGDDEIGFGVRRPVRMLQLDRPLEIGAFSIPRFLVRTSDFRGDHDLPPTAAWVEGGDIVVTGATASQEAVYRLTLGRDVLGGCSSATYMRARNTLSFRCASR